MRGHVAGANIEARTREIGRSLLAAMGRYRPGAGERIEDWLLTRALADPHFRTRALRFLDVLAAFDGPGHSAATARLFREYFAGEFPGIPRPLRWLLRVGRGRYVPAPVVAVAAHRSAQVFAGRFITDPSSAGTRELMDHLASLGRFPSFDLLGEEVLSEAEAGAYEARYLALIQDLSRAAQARGRTPGGQPALQVSLKLSSLTHHFSPVDADGSVERVLPRLVRIAEAARAAGVGVAVDAEQYAVRDIVWGAFQRAFGPGSPLAEWTDAGIAVQSYLRDAEAHVGDVVAFARARGAPFQVRLVKGAYWDYEMAVSAADRWTPPVFRVKAATDRSAERCIDRLLAAHEVVRVAVASHNPWLHAYARAVAEHHRLGAGAVEHQTLHRTSEAMSRALAARGWPARDYVPVGDLLPGMAYLVRRVLENSSQAGFLMQSRQGEGHGAPLASPPEAVAIEDRPRVEPDGATFERAPAARWFEAGFRAAFAAALAAAQPEPGSRLPLPDTIEPGGEAEVRSPSDPDGPPIASVQLASAQGARTAVGRAVEAQPAWAARPPAERSAILRRAAGLLLDRGHEFAAAVVIEGGRDRAGAWAEVVEAVDFLRLYAAEAERLLAEHGGRVRPLGVAAVIPPWNFSLAIPCGMAAAALACGNAVVLKPAGQTPVIASRLVALLHEAGVPETVVQCLPGPGSRVGQALVDDARVAAVAFTGSREVGIGIHEAVAGTPSPSGRPRRLVAEMGGKNPAVVFADADLDEAVAGILHSAFDHANQKCSAVSRVLVERSVYGRFRDRLVEAASSLVCGRAGDPSTQVNPVIDRRASDRLTEDARIARAEGRVLLDRFGPEPGTLVHGPLIVEIDLPDALTARTATEEIFGPILALTAFDREADAYRVANGTAYGLTAAVFSRSPVRIARASAALEAGHVYVNRTSTAARPGVEPFGGMKFSGTGPKVGHAGYLWAFLSRADAPEDSGDTRPDGTPPALAPGRWDAPLAGRIEAVSRAGLLLGARGRGILADAGPELGPTPLAVQVAGQHTTVVHDLPRGLGVVRARGPDAAAWLVAPLLAGNAVVVVDSPGLHPLIEALWAAGVPRDALRIELGGPGRLVALAACTGIAFVACDGGPFRALSRALGPPGEAHRGLRALLSPLDGPQPGESGFVRRFAWPKVVAVRTLRHGATLELASDGG